MPALRRILKYTPALVLGLLVLAWVVSWSIWFGVAINGYVKSGASTALRAKDGYLIFSWRERNDADNQRGPRSILFQFQEGHRTSPSTAGSSPSYFFGGGLLRVAMPITAIATAILPLAIGPFLSFRFRLWHYLAYTAAVAVELAYYLRWQE